MFKHSMMIILMLGFLPGCSERAPEQVDTHQSVAVEKAAEQQQKPNILLIVADDLGYTDLGAFGGEIETPNLDSLASSGVMLTNFHTAPTCSPTRSMLLSGTDNHVAGMGGMTEFLERAAPDWLGKPGYEGYLNTKVATLPELLRDAGYNTYMTGKWHLGYEKETSPAARGFDKSFVLLPGGGGHFTDLGIFPGKAEYREDGETATIPEDFYSSRFYAERMVDYIRDGQASGKPFFAYLAFTAPHWPLQAPDESIAKYRGRYAAGYEALYQQRLQRQKELGLIDADVNGEIYAPNHPAWDSLSDEQRAVSQRKMEIYAAMVDDMDHYVGEVLSALKAMGIYDNTLVIFMSDNGAMSEDVDGLKGMDQWIAECCDNSFDNMGKPDSYLFTGESWARVSTGISRLYKGYTAEGGIRTPAFIHYPKSSAQGRYQGFVSVMDIMPTLLQLAGIEHPGSEYKGRQVAPMKGASFEPVIEGSQQPVHPDNYVMGWELHGNRALREGDWKIVWNQRPGEKQGWALYDVKNDPGETTDLADQQPQRMQAMLTLWDQYVADNGVLLRN